MGLFCMFLAILMGIIAIETNMLMAVFGGCCWLYLEWAFLDEWVEK